MAATAGFTDPHQTGAPRKGSPAYIRKEKFMFKKFRISPVVRYRGELTVFETVAEALAHIDEADTAPDSRAEWGYGLYAQKQGGVWMHIADRGTKAEIEEVTKLLLGLMPEWPDGDGITFDRPHQSFVDVAYWDSQEYHASKTEPANGKPFMIEINDQREMSGQCYIDVANTEGNVDDIMCVTVEVNRLPGSTDDVQCMHLAFDGDNLAASFFKQGDRYIIRPEAGVSIRNTVLPNGDAAFILE